MQIKDILADIDKACAARWPLPETAHQSRIKIAAIAAQLENLKPALKAIKQQKQEYARRFGQAKTANADTEPLRQQMQAISAEQTRLEAQRKQLENEILDLFASDDALDELPRQFSAAVRELTGDVSVREIEDDERALWDTYVDEHPAASLYHKYLWRDVITRSFDHVSNYFVAQTAAGAICGVLPLIQLRSKLFGNFAVSVPFFNYGGPLADCAQATAALLDAAAQRAQHSALSHLEIRSTRALNAWPQRTDKVSMIRRLPSTVAALDEQLGAKVRAQIKRGQNENPQVAIGGIELLDDFYRVFAINMRDLGTPVYGKQFFRNILLALPDNAQLVVLKLCGSAVATAFLLGHRDMMEIPWASTLRAVNALNMNMVLYRAVLGYCIEREYRFFDFGRSTRDSGTFKFKKQWGAEPVQHYWHYWLANGGELPQLKPDSPKFKFLVACWQRLPVAISRALGPHIVKYLP